MNKKDMETVTFVREDGSVYKEASYTEHLRVRLQIVNGEIKEPLYYLNQHGGVDAIDEFGCSDYYPFKESSALLHEIIKAQMAKRIERLKTQ